MIMGTKVTRRKNEEFEELLNRFKTEAKHRVDQFLNNARFTKPSKKRREARRERLKTIHKAQENNANG